MKRTIALFFVLFFCIIAQGAVKVPMTRGEQIKPQTRAVAPADIKMLGSMIARGESNEIILGKWKAMLVGSNDQNLDINALIQLVVRESYLQETEDLKQYQEKVQYFNETKKKIRDEQDKVRTAKITPGSAPLRKMNITVGKGSPTIIFLQNAGTVETEQERQDYVRYLEDKLNAVGDAHAIDLQNALQHKSHHVQMISNISKILKDSAMNVISNMSGFDKPGFTSVPLKKFKNLPSSMKVDPNVVASMNASMNASMMSNKLEAFKQTWKLATDRVALVNNGISGLETRAASLKQKQEECKNKPFTTADIIAANCPDSIVECSKILYANCCRPEAQSLWMAIEDELCKVEGCGADVSGGVPDRSSSAGQILKKWHDALLAADVQGQ